MINYGHAPLVMGTREIQTGELMHYQYLPIVMPWSEGVHLPERLAIYTDMIHDCIENASMHFGPKMVDNYVYITAKTCWVEPGSPGNRPGWHADGFGSNGDLNYIWADMNPTEFAIQDFFHVSEDDKQSMSDMEFQIKEDCIKTFPDKTLLRLDESVVHRVNPNPDSGFRTFFKLSVSPHKYNLVGNSHNHLLVYNWGLEQRGEGRNVDAANAEEDKPSQSDQWDQSQRGLKMSSDEGKLIYKYQMPVAEEFSMKLPKGAKIIRTSDEAGMFWLWAVVHTDAPDEVRNFMAFKTGGKMPDDMNLEYVGFCAIHIQQELGLYIFEVSHA